MWADAIWWLIVLAAIILIPGWFFGYYCARAGCHEIMEINSPHIEWGPALPENRTGRYANKSYEMKPGTELSYSKSYQAT